MRRRVGWLGPAALALGAAVSFAQTPKTIEPIRCWSRTSAGAVTIGQVFTLTVTCAVVETGTVQVVPDESRLSVAAVPLAPFELVGGAHPPDVRAGSRRFFQYDYQLRILDRDAIGHDVFIPPLTLGYRVRTRTAANGTNEGRDLTYVLPAIPVKVLSLVPADAPDIRDAGSASLADLDALRLRSRLFLIGALALAVMASAAAVWAVVPAAAARRAPAAGGRVRLRAGAALRAARAELDAVRATALRADWTDELVARALAALRVAAACAIGAGLSQQAPQRRRGWRPARAHPAPDPDRLDPEGRLPVDTGWWRRARVWVSSPVTARDVARAAGAAAPAERALLDALQAALALFSAARYPQAPARDAAALSDALSRAADAAGRLARTRRRRRLLW